MDGADEEEWGGADRALLVGDVLPGDLSGGSDPNEYSGYEYPTSYLHGKFGAEHNSR